MSLVSPLVAFLALLAGVITLVEGVRVGHGAGNLGSHLGWGVGTLILQVSSLAIAVVHARATSRRILALEDERARLPLQSPEGIP